MIYGLTTDGGILIGLSENNLRLLREGNPILKQGPGMPTLRIIYGETEQGIMDLLMKEGVLAPNLIVAEMQKRGREKN